MEYEAISYNYPAAVQAWVTIVGFVLAGALGLGLLACLRLGPKGLSTFAGGLGSYLRDLLAIRPARVMAVARLTLKEAVRRKALMVFVVFAILLMFGGWFMSGANNRASLQVGVQIWFLLTAISWLVLPVVMFLSCWSIPEDIRVRSLHTVVTKPIRRVEVVLGRIMGFGAVVTAVVVLMGAAGFVWIQRQVTEDTRENLRCRVPAYGHMYFKDRQGNLAREGVNTGDVWTYRSYIEGNTRARAVWVFPEVTPENYPNGLTLESRFEAFRTVKGSETSIEQGLEGQYTLVNNLRDEAFASLGLAPEFRELSSQLVEGQFRNSADTMRTIADELEDGTRRPGPPVCAALSHGCQSAEIVLMLNAESDKESGLDYAALARAFLDTSAAAVLIRNEDDATSRAELAEKLRALADVVEEQSAAMLVAMPRLEVPLPSFHVSEYRRGDDEYTIPRDLSFTADYESLARFLTRVVTEFNNDGKLLTNGELSDDLAQQLSDGTGISPLNAELLVDVLREEMANDVLTAGDNQLQVADERSWLVYMDQLVRAERLTSQDPEGWRLNVDLFDDVVYNGDFLRVEVACMDNDMFMGMARPDLFLRLPSRSFFTGYSKALFSTILMLLLVTVIGVTASCIVKGPVALFLTLGVFLIGQVFHGFMVEIISGRVKGSGLVESAVLIYQQRAPSAGVDTSEQAQSVIGALDGVTTGLLRGAAMIVPDFNLFSRSANYIENGFDVPFLSTMLPAILTFVGFLIPCVLLAAAFLKFRELEAK